MSGNDVVSIEIGRGLHCPGNVVLLPAWIRNSPLLQRVQTECEAQPNSHAMGNGSSISLAETAIEKLFVISDIMHRIYNTGRFIMFFVLTNIYNKKSKGPTLMELFTSTEKLEKFSFDN
jgi:hypothetical protein